jgi:putative redox protein
MKAIARRTTSPGLTHEVEMRGHRLTVDEPVAQGGEDRGPTPQELLAASLASCTAITLELYAARKGWDLRPIEVSCEYHQAERGEPTRFEVVLRLPPGCDAEQRERLEAIAAKCPVHRTLEGGATFTQRVSS